MLYVTGAGPRWLIRSHQILPSLHEIGQFTTLLVRSPANVQPQTPLRFVDQSGSLARFWLRWNGVEVPLPFAWIAAENVQDVLTFDQHGLVTVHFASDAFSSQYPTPVFRQFSSSPDHLPFGILFRSRQDPNLATWLTFDCQGESMHPGYDLRIPMPETDAQFERRSTAWRLFYEKVAGKLEVERSAIEEALAVIPALTERFFGDR